MSATFFAYGAGAQYYYRCFLPAHVHDYGYICRVPNKEKDGADVRSVKEPFDGDVIIYQMPMREWQVEEIQMHKDRGAKIIVDVDDWLAAIPESHHFYEDITHNVMGPHREALQLADTFTASTMFIANKLIEEYDKPVHIFENGIDPKRLTLPKTKQKNFIIGWAGGVGHEEAAKKVFPDVIRFLEDHKDAIFYIVGEVPPIGIDFSTVKGRVAITQWTTLLEYPNAINRFTIALAPSLDNDFYRAKSDLRLLESWGASLPVLCQGPTYEPFVEDGKTALIATDWYEGIKQLYEDPGLRQRLSACGRRYLMNNRTYLHVAPQIKNAVEACILS
jgi:glycosyltransferase involved in cell wall biosynthesis